MSRYITEVILKMCAVTLDLPISILTFIHYVSKTLLNRRQLNPGYFNGHLKGSRRPPRHSTLPVGYFPAQFSHHPYFLVTWPIWLAIRLRKCWCQSPFSMSSTVAHMLATSSPCKNLCSFHSAPRLSHRQWKWAQKLTTIWRYAV